MTLLDLNNLAGIERQIPELGDRCLALTGLTPYEVGCHAMGIAPVPAEQRSALTAACVPVTAGGGVIGNFSYVVADIIRTFTGAQAFVTEKTDVSGLQEAVLSGADIIFTADDDTFMAYNTRTGACSDNSNATGRVFAALLDLASGGIDDDVLVLGVGKAGVGACQYLEERGIMANWYDTRIDEVETLDASLRCPDWGSRSWKYIVDATYAPELIQERHVTDATVVAALGVPFGMTQEAASKARIVLNEKLAFGTIAMFGEVAASHLWQDGGACTPSGGAAGRVVSA